MSLYSSCSASERAAPGLAVVCVVGTASTSLVMRCVCADLKAPGGMRRACDASAGFVIVERDMRAVFGVTRGDTRDICLGTAQM